MTSKYDEISQKTSRGISSLFLRSIGLYGLRAVSIIALSYWLNPDHYGIFGILNSWAWGVALVIPDLALHVALIQQKEEPTLDQMRGLFFVNFARGFFIVAIFFVIGNFILGYHNLGDDIFPMLIVLSLGQWVECIKVPYKMLLERELEFPKVMKAEIFETFVMYAVQIAFAGMGMGVWSFVFALLARGICGLILLIYFKPTFFLPIPVLSAIKGLLSFGLPTQIKTMVVSFKMMALPLILGKILPADQYGLVVWSLGLANIPTVLVENYDRVLFPALSKLNNSGEKSEFAIFATNSIKMSLFAFGFLYGMIGICAKGGVLVFFPEKWLGAITILPIAALSIYLARMRYLSASVLNASGNPGKLLLNESLTLIFEILLALPLAYYYGLNGYFLGVILAELIMCVKTYASISNLVTKGIVRRFVSISLSMIATYYLVSYVHQQIELSALVELSSTIVMGGVVTLVLNCMFDFSVREDIQRILTEIRKKVEGVLGWQV